MRERKKEKGDRGKKGNWRKEEAVEERERGRGNKGERNASIVQIFFRCFALPSSSPCHAFFLTCISCISFRHPVTPLMDMLKTMSPASIDGEFRSLAPEAGGSLEQIGHFMHFLLSQLKTKKNFELVEAYLGLFLKVCL